MLLTATPSDLPRVRNSERAALGLANWAEHSAQLDDEKVRRGASDLAEVAGAEEVHVYQKRVQLIERDPFLPAFREGKRFVVRVEDPLAVGQCWLRRMVGLFCG